MNSIRQIIRPFSFTMMFLVLFSVIGIAADFHYCGEEIKSVRLWSKAEKCSEHSENREIQQPTKACCSKSEISLETDLTKAIHNFHNNDESNGCCSNQIEYYQIDTDRGDVIYNILPDFKSETIFVNSFLHLNTLGDFHLEDIIFQNTSKLLPPLLNSSIRILFQQFRL